MQLVRKTALIGIYPLSFLQEAQYVKGLACKMNPMKKNSPILFDVEKLEEYARKKLNKGIV